jgi:hypothetical protein
VWLPGLDIAKGAALDILAEERGLVRGLNEPDAALRARLEACNIPEAWMPVLNSLRASGWSVVPPTKADESLESAIREANEAQTAVELAELLLKMRRDSGGRKNTLRSLAQFLGGK